MIPLPSIPKEPGCYLFLDKQGDVIYVGKAKVLRNRVKQYFDSSAKPAKTQVLVKNIADIDYIIVGNEVEALLLENKLIKQHSPRYNIMLKDAKTYAYLQITDEKFPRLLTTRRVTKRGEYFGPYVNGFARAEMRRLAIALFQLRTCRVLPKKACLNYHIGLCTAPCIKNVSQEEYLQQVAKAREFLKGKNKPILKKLECEMYIASQKQQFEIALEKKRQIESIHILEERQAVDTLKDFDQDVVVIKEIDDRAVVSMFSIKKGVISSRKEFRFEIQEEMFESFLKAYYSTNYIPKEILTNQKIADMSIVKYLEKIKGAKIRIHVPARGEKRHLVELALKNVRKEDSRLVSLQDALNLADIPRTIECFDISNIGSSIIVAGMTQWVDGKPNKEAYRRFAMKTVASQDDFASMREVIYRRYSHLHKEKLTLPDLIIIDGGKGQLSSAVASLEQLGLSIPIISLAKKDEEIFIPNESKPLVFEKNSAMMLLVRAIRDSVHTYSVSYSRKKKSMELREQTKE